MRPAPDSSAIGWWRDVQPYVWKYTLTTAIGMLPAIFVLLTWGDDAAVKDSITKILVLPPAIALLVGVAEFGLSKQLTRKIEEHNVLLMELWNAFTTNVLDQEMDKMLRDTIIKYSSLTRDHDLVIPQFARENLERAQTILEKRECRVDWYGLDPYPRKLYAVADDSICVTNIGGDGSGYLEQLKRIGGKREAFIELNKQACEMRGRRRGFIRRVFILRESDLSDSLCRLMTDLSDHCIVKVVSEPDARRLANVVGRNSPQSEVRELQDFSLFRLANGKSYSGTLMTDGSQLLSARKERNEALGAQFDALWGEAVGGEAVDFKKDWRAADLKRQLGLP